MKTCNQHLKMCWIIKPIFGDLCLAQWSKVQATWSCSGDTKAIISGNWPQGLKNASHIFLHLSNIIAAWILFSTYYSVRGQSGVRHSQSCSGIIGTIWSWGLNPGLLFQAWDSIRCMTLVLYEAVLDLIPRTSILFSESCQDNPWVEPGMILGVDQPQFLCSPKIY